jgi:hypothetical protein
MRRERERKREEFLHGIHPYIICCTYFACRCVASNSLRRCLAVKPSVKQKVGKVVVVGGGAVGSLFAGRLSTLKELEGRVWLLTRWTEQADVIKGLKGMVVKESEAVGKGCLIGNMKVAASVREILEQSKPDEENVSPCLYNFAQKQDLCFSHSSSFCMMMMPPKPHSLRSGNDDTPVATFPFISGNDDVLHHVRSSKET